MYTMQEGLMDLNVCLVEACVLDRVITAHLLTLAAHLMCSIEQANTRHCVIQLYVDLLLHRVSSCN